MFSRAVLVWDLLDENGAQLFLSSLRMTSQPLPALPCRCVRLPAAIEFPSTGRVVVLRGDGGIAACGTQAELELWSAGLPAPWQQATRDALAAFAHTVQAFRWADGEPWDCGARVRLMGILNVTPDSFSDGGRFVNTTAALTHAIAMAEEGAEIVDVGGESTRPGAIPVDPAEETARVVPLIAALKRTCPKLRVSVDTRHAATAQRALDAGADMVNDVSALTDPLMAPLVARAGVPVVLMHMRGTPPTMQRETGYDDLLGELGGFLATRVKTATEAGIAGDRILLDPGFGFGKSPRGNEEILLQLKALTSLGLPLLVGLSRKRFIGERTGIAVPGERIAGSLAAAVAAAIAGASLVRAHDVRATREALAVASALRSRPLSGRGR